MTDSSRTADVADVGSRPANPGYEAPRLERLGTLAQLTLGGDVGPDDGLGGSAGDEGSLA